MVDFFFCVFESLELSLGPEGLVPQSTNESNISQLSQRDRKPNLAIGIPLACLSSFSRRTPMVSYVIPNNLD